MRLAARVAVIDYEAGNLRSITRALQAIGANPVLLDRPSMAQRWHALILPGVGAFGAAMRRLSATGMREWITDQVASGTPLVGVCLGMQLLYERSEEGGEVPGLGLLRGFVRRLPLGFKVPHSGWNQLLPRQASPLLDGVAGGTYVYFVHSYIVEPHEIDDVVAVASYGVEFPAIVQHARVLGLQFHPEKSGEAGLHLLRNVLAAATQIPAPMG